MIPKQTNILYSVKISTIFLPSSAQFIQESDRIFPPEMPCDVLISVIWTTVSEINLTWKTNDFFGLKQRELYKIRNFLAESCKCTLYIRQLSRILVFLMKQEQLFKMKITSI